MLDCPRGGSRQRNLLRRTSTPARVILPAGAPRVSRARRCGDRIRQGRADRQGRQARRRPVRRDRLRGGPQGPEQAGARHDGHEGQGLPPAGRGRERRRSGGLPEPGPDLPQRVLGLGREPLRPGPLQAAEERELDLQRSRRRPRLLQHPPADERGRAGARQPVLHDGGGRRLVHDRGRARPGAGGSRPGRSARPKRRRRSW